MSVSYAFLIRSIRSIRVLLVAALCKSGKAERKKKRADTRQPSYILHLTSRRSSLQLTASRTAALVATLASATLGDVLFA